MFSLVDARYATKSRAHRKQEPLLSIVAREVSLQPGFLEPLPPEPLPLPALPTGGAPSASHPFDVQKPCVGIEIV